MAVNIRPENETDRQSVSAVNTAAFHTSAEADLVDALRDRASPIVALVAEKDGQVVGHIMFSPAVLTGHPQVRTMGLAPMAVLPGLQGTGIGSKLVVTGLDACRKMDIDAVIVLGHPEFYPRFGFRPAHHFGIRSEYEVADEVFMVLELKPGVLDNATGCMKYHAAFDGL